MREWCMRYIAEIEYYPNCPTCDGGLPSNLEFFNSLRDMLDYALKNINTYGINNVYYVNHRKQTAKILTNLISINEMYLSYEYGFHHLKGIKFEFRGLKLRTIDNGSGTMIWVRE